MRHSRSRANAAASRAIEDQQRKQIWEVVVERSPAPNICRSDRKGETIRGFDERDILHQQADHPFSFAIGCVRVVPESWKVARQGKNTRTRLRIHADAIGLSVSVIGLLRVDHLLQSTIPLGF
jgi:hypothetical protein